eukprot:TRINITY_DN7107_c0_g1_i1.p2 TRINITY_DN7107_c0_g1~~TRINITY_DN7107_c0_g1_i1.p2  ORF type:complete len:159 (-),score=37.44 TRINITY_DN7107_c0_g1_i1:21-497(-)
MAAAEEGIDITRLDPRSLLMMKGQLEEEIEFLSSSYAQLSMVKTRFEEGRRAITSMEDTCGKKMLVPLTSSLYAHGEVASTDTVTVELGTGYYVEVTPSKARDILSRRMEFLAKRNEDIEASVTQKRKNLEAVGAILQVKLQEQQRTAAAAQGEGTTS